MKFPRNRDMILVPHSSHYLQMNFLPHPCTHKEALPTHESPNETISTKISIYGCKLTSLDQILGLDLMRGVNDWLYELVLGVQEATAKINGKAPSPSPIKSYGLIWTP